MTKAQEFDKTVPADVAGMICAVLEAGGDTWGRPEENDWKVEFDDQSYWSASVWFPQDREPYYNGGPKVHPDA